jgi:hypothetical protein
LPHDAPIAQSFCGWALYFDSRPNEQIISVWQLHKSSDWACKTPKLLGISPVPSMGRNGTTRQKRFPELRDEILAELGASFKVRCAAVNCRHQIQCVRPERRSIQGVIFVWRLSFAEYCPFAGACRVT